MVDEHRRPRCPVCKKTVGEVSSAAPPKAVAVPKATPLGAVDGDSTMATTNNSRPFCSERCKMVDLSRWLGGEYAIAGEAVAPDDDGDGP